MTLEEAVNKTFEIISHYESGAYIDLEHLRRMMRGLSGCHAILTKENIEAYNRHNAIMYNFDGSAARAKIEADKEVPELRMTRKLIDTIGKAHDSIRSEIGIIKQEQ